MNTVKAKDPAGGGPDLVVGELKRQIHGLPVVHKGLGAVKRAVLGELGEEGFGRI